MADRDRSRSVTPTRSSRRLRNEAPEIDIEKANEKITPQKKPRGGARNAQKLDFEQDTPEPARKSARLAGNTPKPAGKSPAGRGRKKAAEPQPGVVEFDVVDKSDSTPKASTSPNVLKETKKADEATEQSETIETPKAEKSERKSAQRRKSVSGSEIEPKKLRVDNEDDDIEIVQARQHEPQDSCVFSDVLDESSDEAEPILIEEPKRRKTKSLSPKKAVLSAVGKAKKSRKSAGDAAGFDSDDEPDESSRSKKITPPNKTVDRVVRKSLDDEAELDEETDDESVRTTDTPNNSTRSTTVKDASDHARSNKTASPNKTVDDVRNEKRSMEGSSGFDDDSDEESVNDRTKTDQLKSKLRKKAKSLSPNKAIDEVNKKKSRKSMGDVEEQCVKNTPKQGKKEEGPTSKAAPTESLADFLAKQESKLKTPAMEKVSVKPQTPKRTPKPPKHKGPRSQVDDQFFSLAEMNENLDQLEKEQVEENLLDVEDDSDADADYTYAEFFEEDVQKPKRVRKADESDLEENDLLGSDSSSELEDMGLDSETERRGFDFGEDGDSEEDEAWLKAETAKNQKSPFRHLFAQQETSFEEPMEVDTTLRSIKNKSVTEEEEADEKENEDGVDENDSSEEDEQGEKNETALSASSKKVHFSEDTKCALSDEEDDQEVAEESGQDEDLEEDEHDQTNFQKQQKNMRKVVQQLEEENLAPRSWELSGEVRAEQRDQDELLQTYVEVDYKAKLAPVIDEDVNKRIEAVVIQRIKDKVGVARRGRPFLQAFDDPVRTKRVAESLQTYRARTLDDVERKSLMDMYEEEYKKKKTADPATNGAEADDDADAALDEESQRVKTEMDQLFHKLDHLCHARFRPGVVDDEPKLIVNKPAIMVEEVGQKASTAPDEELMAPEEVRKHVKSVPKAKEERDQTDKLRERRKKKMKQKVLVRKGVKKEGEYKAAAALDAKTKASKKAKKVKQADFYDRIQQLNAQEAADKTTKAKKAKLARKLATNAKTASSYKL